MSDLYDLSGLLIYLICLIYIIYLICLICLIYLISLICLVYPRCAKYALAVSSQSWLGLSGETATSPDS